VVANKNFGAAVTAIKAKQARRGATIMASRAMLAPVAGAGSSDRLAPALIMDCHAARSGGMSIRSGAGWNAAALVAPSKN